MPKIVSTAKDWNYAYNNIQEELSELQQYLATQSPQLEDFKLPKDMQKPFETLSAVSECIDIVKGIPISESSTRLEDMISWGLKGRFLSDAEYFKEQLHQELETMGTIIESSTGC